MCLVKILAEKTSIKGASKASQNLFTFIFVALKNCCVLRTMHLKLTSRFNNVVRFEQNVISTVYTMSDSSSNESALQSSEYV